MKIFMEQMTADIASMIAGLVNSTVAEALDRVNSVDPVGSADGSTAAGRIRDYATTPGTRRQSHAQWLVAARDRLIDDLHAVRRSPSDITARLRLTISSAIYAAAGDAFADIIVSAGSTAADDPLSRPALQQKTGSRAIALHAEQLSSRARLAVFEVTSNDPGAIGAGRARLEQMMLEGDDHNAQIAAALLGIVDDPMNHFKLVRLKDELVDDYNQRKRAEDGLSQPMVAARRFKSDL